MVVSYGLIKMTECWCIPFMVNIIRASILKCALAEQHYLTQCQEQLDQTWWIVNFQMWWWNIALLFTPLPAFCMYCIDVGQSSGSAGVKWGSSESSWTYSTAHVVFLSALIPIWMKYYPHAKCGLKSVIFLGFTKLTHLSGLQRLSKCLQILFTVPVSQNIFG